MPTRTINLKLVLGKNPENATLRRALFSTHRLVNQATKRIEEFLLLCRGEAYRTVDNEGKEAEIPRHAVQEEALAFAKAAQRHNGCISTYEDQEILDVLRQLYERLVPSVNENNEAGDAQAANAWVSPLMSAESEGGLSVYDKVLDPPPVWMKLKEEKAPGWEAASQIWIQSDEGQSLLNKPGSPPRWIRKLRSGQPWQDDFVSDQKKKQDELTKGNAPLIKQLKEMGLLPLVNPFFRHLLDPEGKGVSPWDRLAVRAAVAHFISWESWNHRTRAEYNSLKLRRDEFEAASDEFKDDFTLLRQYEAKRHSTLKSIALADDSNPYRIGVRSLRAWNRVREEWIDKGATEEQRVTILSKLQTQLRGKFGDPDLFNWLAQDRHVHLWSPRDSVTPLVRINAVDKVLRRRKPYALMTFAHPRFHPRWILYEAPGGSNLRQYALDCTENALHITLPLLVDDAHGTWIEKKIRVPLAPSGQIQDLTLEKLEKKKNRLYYRSGFQQFAGLAGGAEVLFHRPYMEHDERSEESLLERPGAVWFKLTLDVATQAPPNWLDGKGRVRTPPEVHHFKTALSNKSKHTRTLQPGLRVLSVDLGMRTFASCSVFELIEGKPETGRAFPVADERSMDSPNKLWAKHERSFKLTLPGETPSRKEEEERSIARAEIYALKRDIQRLKSLLRLGEEDNDNRRDALLEQFFKGWGEEDVVPGQAFPRSLFQGLGAAPFRSTPELWRQHCQTYYDKAEACLAKHISDWRKRTRPRPTSREMWYKTRSYHGGKSIWMLEYLDAVRKLLLSWSLRGRTYGAINRQDTARFGSLASRLLHHINSLKEDRIKTGADSIVQAARGYIPLPHGKGWEQRYEPCQLILFEDLARYRFRVDRPRRENSQLMQWNHRAIVAETTMQAELYGQIVENTAAGFSSRFHAATGAPGVRCRFLLERDFDNDLPKPYLLRELSWMLGNTKVESEEEKLRLLSEKIRPGSLVPWDGGEQFATLHPKRQTLCVIHADMNAAQNLQRRFFGRCGEAFRLVCQPHGDDVLRLASTPGARLLGALQQLENGQGAFELVRDMGSTSQMNRFVMKSLGKKKIKPLQDNNGDDELEDVLSVLPEEDDTGRITVFRDSSGIFFPCNVWIPAKQFWPAVRAMIWKVMASHSLG
ncbi:type V CRISPR-associated protein Cas12b [Desulfovibrio inopinatus]|uniref:type V CRISPR-associated protein Cas12b n=1 Tax=Desulfovibrio inopinatus TaxID=102109 RepID=UPI0003FB5D0D|nr:type V CRISPR-associated protein Cas12b [Desulfovibrio inopinatus]